MDPSSTTRSAATATARRPPAVRSSSARSPPSSPVPTSPTVPNAAKAYFDCVNDNGGINGHPIQYIIETEQTDPAQVASLAKKLVETEKRRRHRRRHQPHRVRRQPQLLRVEGLLRHQRGHRARVLVDAEQRGREHGPALQLRRRRAGRDPAGRRQDRVRPVQRAGHGLHRRRPADRRRGRGRPDRASTDNVPIQDANSVALKLAQAAGPNGGVVLNFTPPEALKILQAAQQQGLAGPRQGVGLLDAVQHRLPGQGAGDEVERQAARQRRAQRDRLRRSRLGALPRGDREVRPGRPAVWAASARWAS